MDKDKPLAAGNQYLSVVFFFYGLHDQYLRHTNLKKKSFSGLPEPCLPVLKRGLNNRYIDIMPDQLTVNQYEAGQGEFHLFLNSLLKPFITFLYLIVKPY